MKLDRPVKYVGEYKFKGNKKDGEEGLSLVLDFQELAGAFGFIMDHLIITKVGSNKIAIGTSIPEDVDERRKAYMRSIGITIPEENKIISNKEPEIILPGGKNVKNR